MRVMVVQFGLYLCPQLPWFHWPMKNVLSQPRQVLITMACKKRHVVVQYSTDKPNITCQSFGRDVLIGLVYIG